MKASRRNGRNPAFACFTPRGQDGRTTRLAPSPCLRAVSGRRARKPRLFTCPSREPLRSASPHVPGCSWVRGPRGEAGPCPFAPSPVLPPLLLLFWPETVLPRSPSHPPPAGPAERGPHGACRAQGLCPVPHPHPHAPQLQVFPGRLRSLNTAPSSPRLRLTPGLSVALDRCGPGLPEASSVCTEHLGSPFVPQMLSPRLSPPPPMEEAPKSPPLVLLAAPPPW